MGRPEEVIPTRCIVLFDGVCNLCSGSIQFIIKRDKQNTFRFSSLQSAFGQEQLKNFKLDTGKFHSIILLKDQAVFQRSDAVLEITKRLSGLWPVLYLFKIIPRFIRDGVYDLIARNRYKLFGKKDSCWLPTPELKSRFID